jgi:hypothetical protein
MIETIQMPATLYHYCSTQTFLAMMSPKPSLRLSSLTMSNDAMEGSWARHVFRQMFDEISIIDGADGKDAMGFVEELTETTDGLGFCMSAQRDMLSQWRGYADDGRGVAIGFSAEYIHNFLQKRPRGGPGISLLPVIYDRVEQETLIGPLAAVAHAAVLKGGLDAYRNSNLPVEEATDEKIEEIRSSAQVAFDDFSYAIFNLYLLTFRLKNPAFREEEEWRLTCQVSQDDRGLEFFARQDRIVPFRTLHLTPLEMPAIREVIIGPRNITPTATVASFLKSRGFDGFQVYRSEATYR